MSDRIITVELKIKSGVFTVFGVYWSEKGKKAETMQFYQSLQHVIK